MFLLNKKKYLALSLALITSINSTFAQPSIYPITYIGSSKNVKLTLLSDTTATYFYKFETSVNFSFKCNYKINKDSILRLSNQDSLVYFDKIIYKNKIKNKIKNNDIEIKGVNSYGVISDIETKLNYKNYLNDYNAIKIGFDYNLTTYCFTISENNKDVVILLNIDNSFLPKEWLICGNSMLPLVNRKAIIDFKVNKKLQ